MWLVHIADAAIDNKTGPTVSSSLLGKHIAKTGAAQTAPCINHYYSALTRSADQLFN